jgi:DNA-binding response OmpR family regulator
MQVLYVEDSPTLRETVSFGLHREGFTVTTAADGNEGLNAALIYEYDVIVLDVMLPGIDGYEVLKRLRAEGNSAEILLLSARSSVDDRVFGLDLGADDYLVKPFAFSELVARIRTLVRRKFGTKENVISVGGLRIDLSSRRLFSESEEVKIRPREFDILGYLALRAGKVVSRTELIEHLYDHAATLKSNAVDSAICNLRKTLENAGHGDLITTVPRRGYLLEGPPHHEIVDP